jgi:dTDP-4-amino-4,6-dideoxygalactose transaminase
LRIPFNKPFIIGKELEYIAEAIESGRSAGDGPFSKRCQSFIQERFGAGQTLLTTSCTAALEMAAILGNIGEGDEVIMPSYTFVSTANAFAIRGARIRFVDIREDTLNIDETLIEQAITDRTRAIVPVHYAGVSCEMDSILALAKRHDLLVIEDAAQGVNARYKGRYLGTLGDMGTYSFHETKNFICGEGGALVTNNPQFAERAEIVREKGTNRSQFFRGEIDKYTWVDIGSSFLPSDLLAAFLYAQLEHVEDISRQREKIYRQYEEALKPLEDKGLIRLPRIPEDCTTNHHMFYILLQDEPTRAALIHHLREQEIHAVFHYVPLHLSPMGIAMGYDNGQLPFTEGLSERLLRLPFYFELRNDQLARIIEEIRVFFNHV